MDEDLGQEDRTQLMCNGDLIIEVKNNTISDIYIYGESEHHRRDLIIPDKAYRHAFCLYVIKGNKLIEIAPDFEEDEVLEKYFKGKTRWTAIENAIADQEYNDSGDYDYGFPKTPLKISIDKKNDDCKKEATNGGTTRNYAEEVRRYELNRMYRDYDEYCDYASNDSEDLDYQYSEDNGYDPY